MKPIDPDAILVRIASGEPVYKIAAEVGMSDSGLRERLKREAPEEYRNALELGLIEGIMRADEALSNASTPLELVAASRLGKAMRYRYRRRPPRFTVSLKKSP